MPSIISEHEQHIDSGGKPIVNGTIHIGARNTDPTLLANKITIYSDRALTIPLANPQATDAEGRSVNKIWVPGRYSITVLDSESAQQYSELDAGENPETGISALTNVQGTNTITADGDPTIDTLLDQQAYIFRAAGGNTGAVTLQIDLTAAKSVLKQHDVALVSGDIEANQTIYVVYNELDDAYEMINQPIVLSATDFNVTGTLTASGTLVPPAGTWTPNLWDTGDSSAEGQTYSSQVGNYVRFDDMVIITGELVITSLGTLSTVSTARIGPLPFTSGTTFGHVQFTDGNSLNITAGYGINGLILNADDKMSLKIWNAATGTSNMLISEVSAGATLRFFGIYYT